MHRHCLWLMTVAGLVLTISAGVAAAQAGGQPNLALRIELRPGPRLGDVTNVTPDSPAQTTFDEGQPITVIFTITNQGTEAYKYADRNYDRSGRMHEYALLVTDREGARQDDPRRGPTFGGGVHGFADLAPGNSFTKAICFNEWVMPLPPGKYDVCGVYCPALRPNPSTKQIEPVRSSPVEIEIRARTDLQTYLEELSLGLRSKDQERQKQAIRYLGYTGSAKAASYLVPAFYESGEIPSRAAETFRFIRDKEACIAALLSALEERGPSLWADSLLGDYRVPMERTFPGVVRGLSLPDRVRRLDAARCLRRYARLGDAALAALLGAAHDADSSVRAAAIGSLCVFQQPAATDTALEASHDPELDVRLAAVFTLNAQGTDRGMLRLEEMIADTPDIAQRVIMWVEEGHSPLARRVLTAGLASKDWLVRIHSACGLFGLGDDSVRSTIADELASSCWSNQLLIINNWLFSATSRRHDLTPPKLPTSQQEWGQAYVDWLRRGQ